MQQNFRRPDLMSWDKVVHQFCQYHRNTYCHILCIYSLFSFPHIIISLPSFSTWRDGKGGRPGSSEIFRQRLDSKPLKGKVSWKIVPPFGRKDWREGVKPPSLSQPKLHPVLKKKSITGEWVVRGETRTGKTAN